MDKLISLKGKWKCQFCGYNINCSFKYGPLYKLGDIITHYFCLLLSTKLVQKGGDNEGILGFLAADIKHFMNKNTKTNCFLCGREKATVICCHNKCGKTFHLPCGLRMGSLHQFINEFKSFCHLHRPVQNIPEKILAEAKENNVICSICHEKLSVTSKTKTLWAPCCLKTWFHRDCVQKLAYNTGYFFKCPTCCNVKKFKRVMKHFGIYVPNQDASWELVPNAYDELLFRYNKCDAENCECPFGREESTANNRKWDIVLCKYCGSQGVHVACGKLKFTNSEWACPSCEEIINRKNPDSSTKKKSNDEGTSNPSRKNPSPRNPVKCQKRTRVEQDSEKSSPNSKKSRSLPVSRKKEGSAASSEIVDVETVDLSEEKEKLDVENEVFYNMKPQSFAYQMKLIRCEFKNSWELKTNDQTKKPELIIISDSSDDEETRAANFPSLQNSTNRNSRSRNARTVYDDYLNIASSFRPSPKQFKKFVQKKNYTI